MRKQEGVDILGHSVKLSERSAQDVLDLQEFAGKREMDPATSIYVSAVSIHDSLKFWMNRNFLRWYYNWKFSIKKLMEGLTANEIFELAGKVSVLDGYKKKVAEEEPQSDGVSQDA